MPARSDDASGQGDGVAGRERRTHHRDAASLSTSQEDYLETIYKLESECGGAVRISDIAARLDVRLPPVTRAVQALQRLGLVEHEERRDVSLTERGRQLAAALAHRHADLLYLLTAVFGVRPEVAEADTCQMEHGISPETAQKLHEFLAVFDELDETTRSKLRDHTESAAFRFLPDGKGSGWRA